MNRRKKRIGSAVVDLHGRIKADRLKLIHESIRKAVGLSIGSSDIARVGTRVAKEVALD